jgi:hypothetical protein
MKFHITWPTGLSEFIDHEAATIDALAMSMWGKATAELVALEHRVLIALHLETDAAEGKAPHHDLSHHRPSHPRPLRRLERHRPLAVLRHQGPRRPLHQRRGVQRVGHRGLVLVADPAAGQRRAADLRPLRRVDALPEGPGREDGSARAAARTSRRPRSSPAARSPSATARRCCRGRKVSGSKPATSFAFRAGTATASRCR